MNNLIFLILNLIVLPYFCSNYKSEFGRWANFLKLAIHLGWVLNIFVSNHIFPLNKSCVGITTNRAANNFKYSDVPSLSWFLSQVIFGLFILISINECQCTTMPFVIDSINESLVYVVQLLDCFKTVYRLLLGRQYNLFIAKVWLYYLFHPNRYIVP